MVSHVVAADDSQIADLVGGDFNCTPESPLYRELESSLGPSVQRLGKVDPFVTWDSLSAKPGAGQTLDYLFVHSCKPFLNLQAVARVAFTAPSLKQRLSDHLGIQAVVDLTPAVNVATGADPLLLDHVSLPVTTRQLTFAGRE